MLVAMNYSDNNLFAFYVFPDVLYIDTRRL